MATEQQTTGKNVSECPVVCALGKGKKYDLTRTERCDGCPKTKHWKAYQNETIDLWEAWFGEEHEFDFEEMHRNLMLVSALSDIPLDRLSLKSFNLLEIYKREQNKAISRAGLIPIGGGA